MDNYILTMGEIAERQKLAPDVELVAFYKRLLTAKAEECEKLRKERDEWKRRATE